MNGKFLIKRASCCAALLTLLYFASPIPNLLAAKISYPENAFDDSNVLPPGGGSGKLYICASWETGHEPIINLEVTDENKTPPSGCCKLEDLTSTWQYDSTTYAWEGAISGQSSPSAGADLGVGNHSVTVTITHTFKCSADASITTTRQETPAPTLEYEVVEASEDGCTPDHPANGVYTLQGQTTTCTNDYWYTDTIAGIDYLHYFTGTIEDKKFNEGWSAHEEIIPGSCETEQSATATPGGSVQGEFFFSAIKFLLNVERQTYPWTVPPQPLKRPYTQVYKRMVYAKDALMDGTCKLMMRDYFHPLIPDKQVDHHTLAPSSSTEPINHRQSFTGTSQHIGYTHRACFVACCPDAN